MRLVAFADLHLDTAFTWAPPIVARRRRAALCESLKKIITLAESVDAQAILCAGDLYEHERFNPATASFLKETFAAANRPVYLTPGNHDWYGPGSLYSDRDWPPNVHVFTEAAFSPVPLSGDVTLWGAAHRAPANTPGFFDLGFRVDRPGIHIGLFHGTERSSFPETSGEETLHAPFHGHQISESGLQFAVVGHYHRPKDAETYIYPGNPDPLSFGDPGGEAVVLEVSPDGVKAERQAVSTSEVHDIEIDVTGSATSDEIRERLRAQLSAVDGCVRVTVSGELRPEIDFALVDLQNEEEGLDALVLRAGDIRVGYDVDAIAEERTVRGQFVRDVRDASVSENDRKKIMAIGLRALEQRHDLEVL